MPRSESSLRDVRTLNRQISHVVGLVEQRACLSPGKLLVSPIGELAGDCGIDVWSDLRVPRQLHRITYLCQQILEASVSHVVLPSGSDRAAGRS